MARHRRFLLLSLAAVAGGCTVTSNRMDPPDELPEAIVKPGITVLATDSLSVISGKKIGLVTNQTGIDERRQSDIEDRKSTRLNSSHLVISYAVFCLKKK